MRKILEPCPDPDCEGKAVRTYSFVHEENRWRCGRCGRWWPPGSDIGKGGEEE